MYYTILFSITVVNISFAYIASLAKHKGAGQSMYGGVFVYIEFLVFFLVFSSLVDIDTKGNACGGACVACALCECGVIGCQSEIRRLL